MTLPPFGAYKYRVSKKLSFTKLSFWRSCFQLGRNTYDICDKSGNAQFGKTQFFFQTPCIYSNISILIVKSFKESESLTYHELLTA